MKRRAGKNNNFIIILFLFLAFSLIVVLMNGETIRETFMNSGPSGPHEQAKQKDIKFVIEYYYYPECKFCKEFNQSGVWEQLEKMAWQQVELVKYQMDPQQNKDFNVANQRASKFNISSVPTIVAVDKSKDQIVNSFQSERTLQRLTEFIKQYDS